MSIDVEFILKKFIETRFKIFSAVVTSHNGDFCVKLCFYHL